MPKALVKRVFLSLLVLVAWLGFVVEGSHAMLNSAATLSGNTISTGSIGLLVSNSQSSSSTTYSQARPGFNFTLAPGQSQETYFLLKNTSQMSVPLVLDALATVQTDDPSMASAISLEMAPVDSSGTVTGPTSKYTLANLNGTHQPMTSSIASGSSQRYKLKVTMDPTYTQSNQTIGYDLVFTGTQQS